MTHDPIEKTGKGHEQAIHKRRSQDAHYTCKKVFNLISNQENATEKYHFVAIKLDRIIKSNNA